MEQPLRRKAHNRLQAILSHINRYSFQGQARLARDAGISRSALSRIMSGRTNPSFAVVLAITRALEEQLGRRLDPREIISMDGSFPTASVCELVGCRGCLPQEAYNEDDTLKPEFKDVKPGQWQAVPDQPSGRKE